MRATTKIIFPIIIFIVALATFGCGGSENGDTSIIEPATTATEVGGADGAALFADTCAGCHGGDATGRGNAPDLVNTSLNAAAIRTTITPVSYTHLRAHETDSYLVCRLLLEQKKQKAKHQ